MSKQRIYDDELHAQFVTFSCYRRRRLLDHTDSRQIVVNQLATELTTHDGICCGFVVKKLDYMHLNPVRAGLVDRATDWAWSSARHFEHGKPVGAPLQWIF